MFLTIGPHSEPVANDVKSATRTFHLSTRSTDRDMNQQFGVGACEHRRTFLLRNGSPSLSNAPLTVIQNLFAESQHLRRDF